MPNTGYMPIPIIHYNTSVGTCLWHRVSFFIIKLQIFSLTMRSLEAIIYTQIRLNYKAATMFPLQRIC